MEKIKLHVGCWKRYIPGWKHVDIQNLPHVDYVTPAHDLHMIDSNACEIVYASHVLEYYDWQGAETVVLPEWYRVLCRGGILRIAVPDFAVIVKLYGSGMALEKFIGPLYGRMQASGDLIYHKTVYGEAKLKELLFKCGFKNPHRYDWRKTEYAHIDDHSQAYIPHMDKENGTLISLNVEATK